MTASEKGLIAALVLACVTVSVPQAAENPAQSPPSTFTLEQLVQTALRENASLASARGRWEAMQEVPVQASSLPNPMFIFRGMDTRDRFPGADEKRYEIAQTFPWPGKRGLRGGIAGAEAENMAFEYAAMQRETVMTVKESYYDLCTIRKSLDIARGEEEVLERMARVAEAKYAAGEVGQQDVAKARAEIPMLRARLLELEAQETTLTARLNALLNREANAPLAVVVEPPPDVELAALDSLLAAAMASRPEIRASRTLVERSRMRRALMQKEYLPDLTAGLEYRQLSEADDMAMFMVGIELPIWRGKYAAGVRETERQIASDLAGVEATEREVQFDVKDAWYRLQTARRTQTLYAKELVPQAELRFEADEAGYSAGKVDFLDLLESERFLLNARVMDAMAEGEVGARTARLEQAIGMDLKPAAKTEDEGR